MQRFGVFFQHTHWTKKQGLPLVPNTTIRIRIRNKLMGIDFPCSTSHAYFRLFILALLLFRTALSESNDCNGEQCIAGNTHVRAKRRKKEEGQYCVQDICLTFDPSDVNIDMRKLLEERGTQVTDALLNDFVRIAPAPRTLCLLVIRDKYEASDWNRWPHSSAKYLTTQILRRAMEMRLMYFVFADVGSLFTEDAVGDDESVASVTAELIQGLRPHAPSADGLLFLLDASVIPSSLATTIRKTFPELPLLNAHTDIRKTNSNFPQLAYDPARDAPPAFVKTTLSGVRYVFRSRGLKCLLFPYVCTISQCCPLALSHTCILRETNGRNLPTKIEGFKRGRDIGSSGLAAVSSGCFPTLDFRFKNC